MDATAAPFGSIERTISQFRKIKFKFCFSPRTNREPRAHAAMIVSDFHLTGFALARIKEVNGCGAKKISLPRREGRQHQAVDARS